jgi:DNA-binding NtrC family response regulator
MKTILLIESDESLRRRLRMFLEFEGFRVIAHPTESSTRAFLEDQPTDVDLVIAGVGREGVAALDPLLDLLENTRVLLISPGECGNLDTPYPCLSRPVAPERVVSRVHHLFSPRPLSA